MVLKSFGGWCCALAHVCAVSCAVCSLYFFVVAAIEYVLVAIVLFGAAIGLEVVAAVIGEDKPMAG